MLDQPVGPGVQVGGVGTEGADDLGLVGAGDAAINLLCPDVGPGGMRVDEGQALRRADLTLNIRKRSLF